MSLSSWSRKWQCQTNRPLWSKVALTLVTTPVGAAHESLCPRSHGAGALTAPPPIGSLFRTWNCTRCMWKTCETAAAPSGEKFHTSQISVAPSAGFSVIGAPQSSGFGMPSESTVPHWYLVICATSKLDPCSVKDTRRVFVGPRIAGSDGSFRCLGGTLPSLDLSGTTVNRITDPVVPTVEADPSLLRYRCVPGFSPVKSTMMSYRSDGRIGSPVLPASSTGAGRKPPSLPITQIGSAVSAGAAARWRDTTLSVSGRTAQAFSTRNR